jgi:hypothetical protein
MRQFEDAQEPGRAADEEYEYSEPKTSKRKGKGWVGKEIKS